MWKLTIEDDEGQQTSIPLAHEEYGIGRDKANTIRLTDRNVSRRHAKLRLAPEGWYVADNDSYNGTYVNGVRIQGEQLIANGDIVQLGDYRLEFLDEQSTTPAGPESGIAAAHQRPNRLVMVVGPSPGSEFPLVADHITVGRAEEAMISINHSSVSRMHAELIALGSGRYEIIDKGSANGIRINGVELRRGILEAGDALELGDVRLRFVGHGKIFRAAEMSQQLAAVGPYEAVSRPAPRRSRGLGPVIGLIVAICILGTAVAVFATRNQKTPVQPRVGTGDSTAQAGSNDAELLAAAKDLLDMKRLEEAHRTVQDISESSPLRDDTVFKDIEAQWADALFAKVEAATDPAVKRTILQEINLTSSFDPERRKRAAEMIRQLDAQTAAAAAAAAQPAAASTGGAVSAATTKPSDPQPGAPPLSPEALDASKIRASIEQKVWSGRGTLDEIRLLAAVCGQLKDYGCRDKARAMHKAKKEQMQQ